MLHYQSYFSKIFTYLVPFLIIIFTALLYFHSDTAITQDLGRHLKLAEIILKERSIPTTNLFSYTYPDFPFLNHHWGSEVIFYLLHQATGIDGLILGTVLLMVIAIALLLFTTRAYDPLAVFASAMLILNILRERIEIRPEIFTYLFFSIYLFILYQEKQKSSRWIYALPPIMVLWVNAHISFVIGIVTYGVFVLDRIILRTWSRAYLWVGIGIVFATLCNPAFIKGALYPLKIFGNYGYSIVENQSPFFLEDITNNPTIFYYKVAIFVAILTLPILIMKKKLFESFMCVVTLALSYSAIRHFPFFALASMVPFAAGISWYIEQGKRKKAILSIAYGFVLMIITLWYGKHMYALISNQQYTKHYDLKRTGLGQTTGGKAMMDYVIDHGFEGPVFNNFDIGSYILYRIYPKERVFVDGRPEAYPKDFFYLTYIPMQTEEDVWVEMSEKYKLNTIIFSHTDATTWGREFTARIVKDPLWHLVYFDDFGMVLVKENQLWKDTKSLKEKGVFERYAKERIQNTTDPSKLARYINFFLLIDQRELAEMGMMKLEAAKKNVPMFK